MSAGNVSNLGQIKYKSQKKFKSQNFLNFQRRVYPQNL